ncbi:3'-5' exonuclease [Candidatus Parvarchaeota archaeon]|nr:3'-5' exonuclease [Candidatus Parvarchaeota archaeon]
MNLLSLPELLRHYYSGGPLVMFDVETNGLNTFHDEIVEIAALVLDKNGEQERFEEVLYLHPNKINAEAWKVHKIPPEVLEKARKPQAVLSDFIAFCKDRSLVAHNIKFDFPILNANLIRHGLRPYQNEKVACTFMYSKDFNLPGKLSELAKHYGLHPAASSLHRAMADVELLSAVMQAMLKEHEPGQMQYSLVF